MPTESLKLAKDLEAARGRIALLQAEVAAAHHLEHAIEEAREYAESIVETVRDPLVVMDADLRVVSASRSFYLKFQVSPEETIGQEFASLGNGQWDIPALRELLKEILPRDTSVEGYEVTHEFETLGSRTMLLNARKIYREFNHVVLILLAIEDISVRRQLATSTRQANLITAIKDVYLGALQCETVEALGEAFLAIAARLTGSEFGILTERTAAESFHAIAINSAGWDAGDLPVSDGKHGVVSMPIREIGRSVMRDGKPWIVSPDECAAHHDRVGTPEGHPELTAFLGVPLRRSDATVGVIGLGNKEGGYGLADAEDMEALAVSLIQALGHKRAELELKTARAELIRKERLELLGQLAGGWATSCVTHSE